MSASRKPNPRTRSPLTVEALEARVVLATSPYVVPANAAVTTQTILTVGDSVNLKPDGVTPYRAVGIMDGMGAYDNGDGTFSLVMNHEIPVGVPGGVATPLGVARAHGNAGAFVSLWTIEKATLKVLKIEDLLQNKTSIFVSNNDPATGAVHTGYLPGDTTVISRLCSADLAAPGAYGWTDPATGVFYGTTARIFQTGEESGGIATSIVAGGDLGPEPRVDFGRQWNMILTDDPNIPGDQARTAYEMPHCGLFPWENNLASPFAQRKTIVMGMDDSVGGQIYVWVGDKQTTGNVVERAGLTKQGPNDNLYVVKVTNTTLTDDDYPGNTNPGPSEARATPLSGTFTLENEGDVSGLTFAGLEALSDSKGGTQFLRPEDGQWDPNNPNDYYFVTTDRLDQVGDGVGTQVGRSRLYRLRFTDITQPELGGTITAVLDGTEGGNMFDNMTMDRRGRVFIQEDVGNAPRSSKIWMYDIKKDELVLLAKHDAARFGDIGVAATAPFTQDEESSGIIDVSDILGPGTFLINVQGHYNPGDAELVEGGQLLLMRTNPVTASLADGVLTVNGSLDADSIVVTRIGGNVAVLARGRVLGRFPAADVTSLRIDGSAGNDVILVSGGQINALLRGGHGNDVVVGGGGRNVLVGGAGRDTLIGGGRADLLIGGEVADGAALDGAFTAWTGGGTYTERADAVAALLAGKVEDTETDVLFGLGDLDLFFRSPGDLSDRLPAERANG